MIHARSDYNRIQDPLKLIDDDEPVFLLRAKDIAAPGTVEAWVNLARIAGADNDILDAATKQAEKMRQWQINRGCNVPDMKKSTTPI